MSKSSTNCLSNIFVRHTTIALNGARIWATRHGYINNDTSDETQTEIQTLRADSTY